MTPDRGIRESLPEPVHRTLDDFRRSFGLDLFLFGRCADGERIQFYPEAPAPGPAPPGTVVRSLSPRDGPALEVEIRAPLDDVARSAADVLAGTLSRTLDFAQEIRFFTHEVSERYEEINLLYSISETLGSILHMDEAARIILHEVCDVLGARRGSLWVHQADRGQLRLIASVGDGGREGPLPVQDPEAVTARVFREGRATILARGGGETLTFPLPPGGEDHDELSPESDSVLSVPIRYSPLTGDSRTVGVINLIGRTRGGRFTASDQKLLSAIASQVGAALENNRLIRESLARERMSREMELAHDLQMKLLTSLDGLHGVEVAARVEPAESVGGDFYHVLRLRGGKLGVMIGDVSSHGFPAALIMALSMSAASIFAAEVETPGEVLRHVDEALRDELETTEMYLTLFYGVVDPEARELTFANAGHPHAFVVRQDGVAERLLATSPPVGIAGPGTFSQTTVPWNPGEDLLLLFTDGLSDFLSTGSRSGGEEVVVREAARLRTQAPGEIVSALFALVDEATPSIPSDDRTALVLRG